MIDPDFPNGFTEYELMGTTFRVGPPEIITREDGDKTIVRFECQTKVIRHYEPIDNSNQKAGKNEEKRLVLVRWT